MKSFFLKKDVPSLVLFSIVLSILFCYFCIQLYTEEYIKGSVSDDAYYYALGNSLFQNGFSQDVTVTPARFVLNAHWGITIVYGFLSFIGFDFVGISISTLLLGLILHLLSIYPLIQLAKRFKLPESVAWFILVLLSLSPYYIEPILGGRTESFFFPLALFWVNECFNWVDGNRKTMLFIFLSIFLISFRMQAIIYFGAMFITLIGLKKWKETVKIGCISLGSVFFVYFFNFLISGYFSSRSEASVTNAISDVNVEVWIKNIKLISQLLLNHESIFLLLISITVLLVLLISGIVGLFEKWSLEKFFANTLIWSACLSFILAMPIAAKAGHLRYISYILPFLFLLGLDVFSKLKHFKHVLSALLILMSLIQMKGLVSSIKHIEYERLKNVRSIDRFNQFQNLFKGYENKVYGYNLIGYETHRLFYSSTKNSLHLVDSLITLKNKDGYIISTLDKKEELASSIENPEYYFKINNEYFVAKLKVN